MSHQMSRLRKSMIGDQNTPCAKSRCSGNTKTHGTFIDLISGQSCLHKLPLSQSALKPFDLTHQKNTDFKRFDMISDANRALREAVNAASDHVPQEVLDIHYEQLQNGPRGYSIMCSGDHSDIKPRGARSKPLQQSILSKNASKPQVKGKFDSRES